MTNPKLLFAGGGTGGHVFPLIAVADAVQALDADIEIVFVGTERGIESRVVPERGYALELLDVIPMRGSGVRGLVRGSLRALRTLPEARTIVKRHAPHAVFSVGGYAAGPVTVAARALGVPLALMEPNSAIGLANRLIAPLVQRAYTAFPESERHFGARKVLRTGVPIRAGFEPRPYPGLARRLRVLVLGGSQGAKSLNEAVPAALSRAKTPVSVIHQAGKGREAEVRALYERLGAGGRAQIVPFIDDMAAALATADLVIGRAGASAVAEICAVGRPSVLVPYPYAGDHQRFNAVSLADRGAAVCLLADEATEARIAEVVDALTDDPARLEAMARAASSLGRPDAATTIARDLIVLAGLAEGTDSSVVAESDRDGEANEASRWSLQEVR